jgi:hypothetical protein
VDAHLFANEGARLGPKTLSIATVIHVRTEVAKVPALNLEVSNAHTFFVGESGFLVHNCQTIYRISCPGRKLYIGRTKDSRFNQRMAEHGRSGRKPAGSTVDKLHECVDDDLAPWYEQGEISAHGGPRNGGGGTSNGRNERCAGAW